MTGRLDGKTAIVVGAGQTPGETIGNGKATALRFGQEGAHVLCVDLDLERAEAVALEIVAASGQASGLQADIALADDAAKILALAEQRMGRVDILVNNVGIGFPIGQGGDGRAAVLSELAYDRTMEVNLKGMWLTIKAAVPVMSKTGGGSIINISSLESVGGDSLLAYELSKAGVNRLTVAVAMSYAKDGLRCNAILPGLMDTPLAINTVCTMAGCTPEEARAMLKGRVPLSNELGSGWDTAHAALFLASDEARHITGVLLPVDGGMAARVG